MAGPYQSGLLKFALCFDSLIFFILQSMIHRKGALVDVDHIRYVAIGNAKIFDECGSKMCDIKCSTSKYRQSLSPMVDDLHLNPRSSVIISGVYNCRLWDV